MERLSSMQKRIFLGSFFSIFFIVFLQLMQLTPSLLIKPIPEKEDIFKTLDVKLQQHKNTFRLQKRTSFIAQTHAAAAYDQARSYALIDLDNGEVIREKGLSESVPIASLTKIMTAVVALDLADPDEHFTVTKHAADQIPTKIGVVPGEKLTLSELLHATMLTSGNDAAQVISDGIDEKYKEAVFIRAMNRKASFLGLKDTHFTNPQGFDNADHYSSAEDLTILTKYALTHYPFFREVVKKDYVFLPENVSHKQFDLYNWNGLIGVYPNVSGVKIGNTGKAGRTTIVVSERGGKTLLAVILGAPGILERDAWAASLLDEGFKETVGLPPVNITEEQLREKYASWNYF